MTHKEIAFDAGIIAMIIKTQYEFDDIEEFGRAVGSGMYYYLQSGMSLENWLYAHGCPASKTNQIAAARKKALAMHWGEEK